MIDSSEFDFTSGEFYDKKTLSQDEYSYALRALELEFSKKELNMDVLQMAYEIAKGSADWSKMGFWKKIKAVQQAYHQMDKLLK